MALCSCQSNELKTSEIQNRTGLELFKKGDHKKAGYFFRKAADHENLPDTSMAIYFYNIARAYSSTLQPDSAKLFYRKARKLYEVETAEYKIVAANIFLMESKVDSARNILEEAIKIDSLNGTINNLLGLIYIGDYGQDYFNPQVAYKFNNRAFLSFKDAASKLALAKNEYFINHLDRSIVLFSQFHQQYPREEGYLGSLILIKGEKGDQANLTMILGEYKRRFPDRYNNIVSNIAFGKHALRWNF